MRPSSWLDVPTLRENARVWTRRAGVPLRAVVKSDGYGWGASALVRALDDFVDAFVVADVDEFDALAAWTRRPIVLLQDVCVPDLARLLDAGAIPNVTSLEGVEAAAAWARARGRPARVRVGLSPAVAWPGFDRADLIALAARLARPELEIELWTHLTHPTLAQGQRDAFVCVLEAFEEAGVHVVATDIESTFPLTTQERAAGSFVRLGVGLFGARYGSGLSEVRCALRLEAPVVRRLESRGQLVGYSAVRAPGEGHLHVVRCGYGDGFARVSEPATGILFVGMQYTVVWRSRRHKEERLCLLDADTDLDALAQAAGVTPHELILALGNAARKAEP